MVSFNTNKEIKDFAKQYGLNYPNLIFLQDPKHEFKQWFGKTSIPAVFIYNAIILVFSAAQNTFIEDGSLLFFLKNLTLSFNSV